MVDKVRENRLRRMASRQRLRLSKVRRLDPRAYDFGSYLLRDGKNKVVLGGGTIASLDDVERYLTGEAR
jgi:hypothetical protein